MNTHEGLKDIDQAEFSTVGEFTNAKFDYLIVGGGTAGLAVAARLSEHPNVKVGILEAGSGHVGDPVVEMPAGMTKMLNNPEYDWDFKSVPQAGNNGKVHGVARGKMLGGSSGINFHAYGRPSSEDLDDWCTMLGNEGWSWADLKPYFRRSERLEFDQANITNRDKSLCPLRLEEHGLDGNIHTSLSPWQFPEEEPLMQALDSVSGLPRPTEPWAGSHLGFYRFIAAMDRSSAPKRSYAANGYLAPILSRANLKVITRADVRKVLFDEKHEKVAGIEFAHGGKVCQAHADREVVLSAGSIQTPRILEHSGIGDPAILKPAGIPCVLSRPEVGTNLQEKPVSAVVYELADEGISVDALFRNQDLFAEHQRLLKEQNSGALAGAISLTGYMPYCTQVTSEQLDETVSSAWNHSSPSPQYIDFQEAQHKCIAAKLTSPHSAAVGFVGIPANFNTRATDCCNKLNPGAPEGRNACYSIMFSTMYPLSRGTVHVTSNDPAKPPRIDLGFLTHPGDVDVLAAGATFADRVFRSEHLQGKVKARIDPPPSVDLEDPQQAKEHVRSNIVTYHHVCGTCAMGQVTDERLRLKGMKGLRIVDASVMPMQVSNAILGTVYAIAEKAADMIKADAGGLFSPVTVANGTQQHA